MCLFDSDSKLRLANTSIPISAQWSEGLFLPSSLGILFGLIIGKPLGIWAFTYYGSKIKLCLLPQDLKWKHIFGAGFLGGIGFTMSIFITLLAFESEQIIDSSKIAIMILR